MKKYLYNQIICTLLYVSPIRKMVFLNKHKVSEHVVKTSVSKIMNNEFEIKFCFALETVKQNF